ncbi:hypothetical protein ABIQ69_11410 [Agromyces sp. G08B096]|uniref:Uncharacterized protein n=1 Tax=Agromyces sp. G08B096 TaxID=3156399 RepID=A0AAU7W3H5_9MICO
MTDIDALIAEARASAESGDASPTELEGYIGALADALAAERKRADEAEAERDALEAARTARKESPDA